MSEMPEAPDPNKPLSQETLAELLAQHKSEKDAMRQEFESATSDPEGAITSDNVKERIGTLGTDAWVALKWLVNNADSESVRATCSKYVLDIMLGRKKVEDNEDAAIAKLVESLRPKA
jgi:hypothetical protein